MNVHSAAPTDPDAFLRWNHGREGKREQVNGEIVEIMVLVTRGHARLITNLIGVLLDRLDRRGFEIYANDIGVKTPAGVRFPDVVVDRAGGSAKVWLSSTPSLYARSCPRRR